MKINQIRSKYSFYPLNWWKYYPLISFVKPDISQCGFGQVSTQQNVNFFFFFMNIRVIWSNLRVTVAALFAKRIKYFYFFLPSSWKTGKKKWRTFFSRFFIHKKGEEINESQHEIGFSYSKKNPLLDCLFAHKQRHFFWI